MLKNHRQSRITMTKKPLNRLPTGDLTTSFGHALNALQPQKIYAQCVFERRTAELEYRRDWHMKNHQEFASVARLGK